MTLSEDEKHVARAFQPEQMALIEKMFIRPFQHLPGEYRSLPNDALGEQVKAHLTARDLNVGYLRELKKAGIKEAEGQSIVAPD